MTHETNALTTVAINSNRNSDIYSYENKFSFQNELHPALNSHTQLNSLTFKIFSKSVNSKQGIHPRLFCRRWFGFDAIKENGRPRFSDGQILAMESEHGYREQCINLLARVLKIKPNTIHRWGKGVSFDKIPTDKREKYEIYLSYVDAIRIITASLSELEEASLLRLLRKLEIR